VEKRVKLAALSAVFAMAADISFHSSIIAPAWSESAMVGLITYMFMFIYLTIEKHVQDRLKVTETLK
jgi:hypothetical protein